MPELIIKDKQKFFDENYPFSDPPKLSAFKLCIHCDKTITVGDYKVFTNKEGFKFICCPNAPECNGTVIDWGDFD